MVLGILVAVIAVPGLLGSQEAIRQSQSKEKREEHRARPCNLIATCVKSSMRSREIDGRPVVLRNGKLWIDTGTPDDSPDGDHFGHPYAGYYLPYPDTAYEGLVTTITDEAPIMNWVYIDKDTYEVKYGARANAQPNLTGPFDCTRQDRRLTFEGWEGFVAVEEGPKLWALYFDREDDGLRGKVAPGTRVLEIELSRKEKRWKKERVGRLADQTTKRSVEVREDAPVDRPIAGKPKLEEPGSEVVGKVGGDAAPKPLSMPTTIFPEAEWLRRPLPAVRAMSPPPAYTAEPEGSSVVCAGSEKVSSSTASNPGRSILQKTNLDSLPDGPFSQTARFEISDAKPARIPSKARATLPDCSSGFTDFISAYMHEETTGEIPERYPGRPDSMILTPSSQNMK